MKAILILVFIGSFNNYLFAQKDIQCNDFWTDSVFTANFKKMEYAATYDLMYDNYVDRKFVLILISFSGIQATTLSYSGFPAFNVKRVEDWKEWYEKYKCKISKEKFLRAYSILNDPDSNHSQLDSLFNKSRIE